MDFNPDYCRNEKEVEGKLIIQYLLPHLGYRPESWYQEVAFGAIRLDFLVFATQILPFTLSEVSPLSLVIEAKHPQQKLDQYVYKLGNYLRKLRATYGVLTNGREFRIYHRQNNKIELKFSCSGSEISANLDNIKRWIGRDQLKPVQNDSKTQLVLTPDNNLKSDSVTIVHSPNPVPTMKIIAVYHNKGGVGKTTTVVNLAAALAKRGKRVLIVDLDSQANTTYAVGLAKFLDEENDDIKGNSILEIIRGGDKFGINEVARKTTFSDFAIDAIPSHIELMESESKLNNIDPARIRLSKKLEKVKFDYDFVLIDTPPSLNLYARIALITAQYLIIPSDLKPFANEGLINVSNFVSEINESKDSYNLKPLEILGVLPCKVSTNRKFIDATLPKRIASVEKRYGFPVMNSRIYEREDIAKSLENEIMISEESIPNPRSVIDFRPDSASAKEFEEFAAEVLEKIALLDGLGR